MAKIYILPANLNGGCEFEEAHNGVLGHCGATSCAFTGTKSLCYEHAVWALDLGKMTPAYARGDKRIVTRDKFLSALKERLDK